jgi:transglutaminase-like putative cysteine protease
MSVDTGRRSGYEDSGWDLPPLLTGDFRGDPLLHAAALGCLAVLSLSYLAVLYHVTDVVGGTALFVPVVLLAAGAGAVVGRTIDHRTAVAVAVGALGLGLVTYLLTVPPEFFRYLSVERVIADQVAFLTGYSVLRMTNAGVWAVAVAPAPTFLTWYFAARGEYVRAATVGSGALLWFVLTGDSGSLGTMVGILGAAGAVGFDSLAVREGHREQAETVVIAVAAMVLGATLLSVTPTVGGAPIVPTGGIGGGGGGGGDGGTLEASLLQTSDSDRIEGSIRLSPKVRFTVEADRGEYWRVSAFDRFTGQGWVRTGGTQAVSGPLDRPPGPREQLRQRVVAEATMGILPAAAEPYRIDGVDATVSQLGTVGVRENVPTGASYTVTSQVLNASPEQLRAAGADYPAAVRQQYLQLPESTPQRVRDLTANVTADADSPYEKAAAIETYLERNKGYSLNVTRPEKNVAAAFLFDMEAGYCVYFATTMVAMLRAEGIPARYAVGYTPGQRVSEDEWVVRGLDSHAWVEVYLPDYGWVRFDPTPSGPRQSAEQRSVETAREQGVEGVDAAGSENGTFTTTRTTNGTTGTFNGTTTQNVPEIVQREQDLYGNGSGSNVSNVTTTTPVGFAGNGTTATDSETGGDGFSLPSLPVLAVWSLLALGAVAAVRRSGVAERVYRAAWLRVPPRGDPDDVVEGAFRRAMFTLERWERPRQETETVREYLDSVDADRRTRRLAQLREEARYRGGADEDDAAEARRLVSELVGRRGGQS